jgi:glycine cleavage system protein P-like pyridoxal-binding family
MKHTFTKVAKNSLKKLFSAYQKHDGNSFWNMKGVLMVEFMQHGTTVTLDVYCKTLKKLYRTIQNKKHMMPLHDNVCPHTVAHTQAMMKHFNYELFNHLLTALSCS